MVVMAVELHNLVVCSILSKADGALNTLGWSNTFFVLLERLSFDFLEAIEGSVGVLDLLSFVHLMVKHDIANDNG